MVFRCVNNFDETILRHPELIPVSMERMTSHLRAIELSEAGWEESGRAETMLSLTMRWQCDVTISPGRLGSVAPISRCSCLI